MLLAQAGVESLYSTIIMFGVIGLVFYFLILRPQKKQQKEFKETIDNLKVGDHIVTRAGLRGEVVQLKGDSFILISGPDKVKLEYLKQAISYIEASYNNGDENNPFTNTPVGDLSYGNDKRFIDTLNDIKEKTSNTKEFDILIEDVYEYVVVEDKANVESVKNTFRLQEERSKKILDELTELGVISAPMEDGNRFIVVDPRK